MPTETEEPRTDFEFEEQEEEGGPVKSFLEHLEDLRWVLIKIAAAVGVAMLLCLIAGDKAVAVIMRPLHHATIRYPGTNHVVTVQMGTNVLRTLTLTGQQQQAYGLPDDRFLLYQLEPTNLNGVLVLALRRDTSADAKAVAQHMNIDVTTFGPASGFFVAFQVAFYGGVALASPFIFFIIAQFVFPALKLKERKYIYRGLGFAFPLFALGVSFCYFLLMPIALAASQLYSKWLGFSANVWRAEEYISFVCKFLLGMGLGFEMPVVILVLVKIGILNYQMLSKARRYMIVINLVLGAVLTTPEVLTQLIMFIPLQLLYEISIWVAWYWERSERKRTEQAEAATA